MSRFVSELANRKPWSSQPYVGDSAFAHKGGIHVSAVLKHPETYEHIDPEAVGNHRRVLVSELAGQSNVLWKAREYGIDLDKNTPDARRILELLKRLEDEGFQFEGAEASFELLMERALGNHRPYFELQGFRVIVEEQGSDAEPVAEATVQLRVKGIEEHTAASGNGPVNALDHALRKALEDFYPNLREMTLARLQGPHPRRVEGHRGQDPRAHHLGRRRRDLGHGGGGRQYHRGVLAGAGGLRRVQAATRRAARPALTAGPRAQRPRLFRQAAMSRACSA